MKPDWPSEEAYREAAEALGQSTYLRHVSPLFPTGDQRNTAGRHAESAGDRTLAGAGRNPPPYLHNVGRRQLGGVVTFAMGEQSVPTGMLPVLVPGYPFEVDGPVVDLVAVLVVEAEVRGTRANLTRRRRKERARHENMNPQRYVAGRSATVKSQVPPVIRAQQHESGADGPDAIPFCGRPSNGPYATKIRYFVDSFPPLHSAPFL